jgi:uncharacterized protein YuzE
LADGKPSVRVELQGAVYRVVFVEEEGHDRDYAVAGAETVRVTYDPEADVLAFYLRETAPVDGREVAPGLIVTFDKQGQPIYIELLSASRRVAGDPLTVALEYLAPAPEPAAR